MDKVPPTKFNEQFMKDLSSANNLDQIKWIFNGSKKPADFKKNMEKAIENLKLDKKTAQKFGKNSPDELKKI